MDQSDKILQAISKLENKIDSGFRRINQRLDNIAKERLKRKNHLEAKGEEYDKSLHRFNRRKRFMKSKKMKPKFQHPHEDRHGRRKSQWRKISDGSSNTF